MAVGPLRGGGSPPVKPLTEKPKGADEQPLPQKVLEKAVDGVLKPGQHMVLPARTGLAHFKDHFDARGTPDYDKLLKGEVSHGAKKAAETAAKAEAADVPRHKVVDDVSTAMAAESALAMMDLLPQIAVPPPLPMMRAADVEDPDEAEEAEERRDRQEQRGQDDDEPQTDPGELPEALDFAPPQAPELPQRAIELQVGLFTLDEGSVDLRERRLCTLEAFLDGDVPYVSVAVDLQAIPDGAPLHIAALDAAAGRRVPLRAVHSTSRTEGVGTAYIEVCVSELGPAWQAALEKIVTVEIG